MNEISQSQSHATTKVQPSGSAPDFSTPGHSKWSGGITQQDIPARIYSITVELRTYPKCLSETENGAGRNDFSDAGMFHVEH